MFKDINEVMTANRVRGHHFFDRDTLHAFSSRVLGELYGGRYFVTSERDTSGFGRLGYVWNGERRYTLRRAHDDGTIETIGANGGYKTAAAAKARARQAAAEDEEFGAEALEALRWVRNTQALGGPNNGD